MRKKVRYRQSKNSVLINQFLCLNLFFHKPKFLAWLCVSSFFVISTFIWFSLLASTESFHRVMAGIRSNKSHSGITIHILPKALRIGWDREALESLLILFINENNLSTLALEIAGVNKSSTKSNTQLHESFLHKLNILHQTMQ